MTQHIAGTGQKSDGIPEIHAHELFLGSNLLTNQKLWVSNFRATLTLVRAWCDDRRDSLRRALVDVRSSKVVFYFVPDGDRYDLSLGQHMTDLEVNLLGSAGLGYIETLQVPEKSVERFVGGRSVEIWQHESQAALKGGVSTRNT